jgi:hypothetical protein
MDLYNVLGEAKTVNTPEIRQNEAKNLKSRKLSGNLITPETQKRILDEAQKIQQAEQNEKDNSKYEILFTAK